MATEADTLKSIFEWSKDLPIWQRDALRRLSVQLELAESDIEELTSICLGVSQGVPIEEADLPDPKKARDAVNLRQIHDVKNINALAPDQRSTFQREGLTIVYGDNGSGKSSYARILKKVCRSRVTRKSGEILPNIYDSQPGVPSAIVGYELRKESRTYNWQLGQQPAQELSLISVFDSDAASIHVDESNDIAYTPYPLKLLAALAGLCRLVKDKLNNEIIQIKAKTPVVISKPDCRQNTKVGKLLSTLSAETDPVEVENLATFTKTEKERLIQITSDLSSDPVRMSRRLADLKASVNRYIKSLDDLFECISEEKILKLNQLATASRVASKAAEAASAGIFSEEPLPQIDSEVWRVLWSSARAFSEKEAYPEQAFPATSSGSVCVLCQQELTPAAASRLTLFEEFVKNDSQRNYEDSLVAYKNTISLFANSKLTIRELSEFVRILRDELQQDALATTVRRSTLKALLIHRNVLRCHAKGSIPLSESAISYPKQNISDQLEVIGGRITALQTEVGSPARMALQSEAYELTDSRWLSGIKGDVLAEIDRLKQIDAIELALRNTITNRITAKSTEVSQALVTNALRAKFISEVASLNIAGLAVELQQQTSSLGIPKFKVVLVRSPGAVVGSVLSEGEYRCVALAAFLAELAITENMSGIVFDDPVSSLDHRHREIVAKRLAVESKQRQVIVFTHDLAFLFELERAIENSEPRPNFVINSINKGSDKAGYCQNEPPFKARRAVDITTGLEKRLNKERYHFDSGNEDEWRNSVKSIAGVLRDTWEIAVEEAVSHVTKRLSNEIKTPGLIKLTVLTIDDCVTMRDAFGRCSELLHSASHVLNRPMPNPERLQAEINALSGWAIEIKERQGKAKI